MWSDHAYRVLPITLYIFIGLYLLFTLSHVFVVETEIRTPLVFSATLSAVFAAAIRAGIRHPLVHSNAESLLLLLVAMGAFNSLLHLMVTGDIFQSTNLIFVIAVCGFLVTNTHWFVGFTVVTLLLWGVIASWLAESSMVHFAYSLLVGTVMGGLLHHLRRQSIKKEYALEDTMRQLTHANQYDGAVLQSVSNGVLIIDVENRVTFCNQAISELLGLSEDEIKAKTFEELFSKAPPSGQIGTVVIGHSDSEEMEFIVMRSDVDPESPESGSLVLLTPTTKENIVD